MDIPIKRTCDQNEDNAQKIISDEEKTYIFLSNIPKDISLEDLRSRLKYFNCFIPSYRDQHLRLCFIHGIIGDAVYLENFISENNIFKSEHSICTNIPLEQAINCIQQMNQNMHSINIYDNTKSSRSQSNLIEEEKKDSKSPIKKSPTKNSQPKKNQEAINPEKKPPIVYSQEVENRINAAINNNKNIASKLMGNLYLNIEKVFTSLDQDRDSINVKIENDPELSKWFIIFYLLWFYLFQLTFDNFSNYLRIFKEVSELTIMLFFKNFLNRCHYNVRAFAMDAIWQITYIANQFHNECGVFIYVMKDLDIDTLDKPAIIYPELCSDMIKIFKTSFVRSNFSISFRSKLPKSNRNYARFSIFYWIP